jgi:alpha-1,3-rhamnosyl/mannosyltransferase
VKLGFGCTVLVNGMRGNGVDGIGSYTREIGGRLVDDPSIELTPVCFGPPPPEGIGFSTQPVKSLGHYARYAGVSVLTPFGFPDSELRDLDLFHATDHLIARFSRFPVIATLMDAIPLSHPEWVRMRYAHAKNWLWRRATRWAEHILTISDYSKQDISRYFGIDADKISVVPLGVDDRYFERFNAEQKRRLIHELGLPDTFYLFVGTLQPRKNLERLLDAHASLPASLRKDAPLVIVGRLGWGCEALMARLGDESSRGRVYWLNYLPDLKVRLLMQTACALVFPSLYEGFGLPVVEAFASGLPVITSNTTSLPEVAGEAALLVDPSDTGGIADAMRQIVEIPGLPERLVAAGEKRARELTWSSCAQRTLDVYRKVLGRR